MKISAADAPALAAKPLPPITLIRGSETQLNFEALDIVRARAKKDGNTDRQRFDPARTNQWPPILAALESQSLFCAKQLIEIYAAAAKLDKNAQTVVERIAKTADDSLKIILHLPNLERPEKLSWYKALEQRGLLDIESRELSRSDYEQQIARRLAHANIQLTRTAYERFLEWHEGNITAAAQAITLITQSGSSGAILDEPDIARLLGDAARLTVSRFQQALLAGDWLSCYRAAQLIEQEDPQKILAIANLIQRDMSVLYQLAGRHSGEHADIFQTHRIYRRSAYEQALRHYPLPLIAANLKLAAKLDRISKGAEAGNPWLTLRQYCLLRIR